MRYTGTTPLKKLIADQMMSNPDSVTIDTSEGPLTFRVIGTEASLVTGTTTNGKLVTINTDSSERIIIT